MGSDKSIMVLLVTTNNKNSKCSGDVHLYYIHSCCEYIILIIIHHSFKACQFKFTYRVYKDFVTLTGI